MTAQPQPPPQSGGMSLYEDLLGGPSKVEAPAAPVAAAEAAAASTAAPKSAPDPVKANPALRFQPIIRRPQQAKARPKAPLPKVPIAAPASASAGPAPPKSTSAPVPAPTRTTTLADWTAADGEDDDYNEDGRPGGWAQRGGRKRKKGRRAREEEAAAAAEAMLHQDYWDELYDPARPTNLDAYLRSDERVAAAREWKAVLYAHRRVAAKGRRRSHSGSDRDSDSDSAYAAPNKNFAPPPSYAAFAPPPSLTTATTTTTAAARTRPHVPEGSDPEDDTMGDAPLATDDDTTRLKAASQFLPPPPQPAPQQPQQTRPQPSTSTVASLADGLVVSKAPVRFVAAAQEDEDQRHDNDAANNTPETDALPSRRPGQAGFAARLMAKYGWTKGTGLGAVETGIVNPLRHKRQAGAGGNMGKIVGGHRPQTTKNKNSAPDKDSTANDDPPRPSPVIVLRHMLDGLALDDLAAEVADGQLVQEIGEECGEQYGRLQRVHIAPATRLVFLQFTEAVSALRAVQGLQGRIFNGNAIEATFYDEDKFDAGIYE